MIGGWDGRPVENSTGPGTPTPTARTSAGVRPASASTFWASRSTSARTGAGPSAMSIGWPTVASTCEERSVTATSTLVTPRSTARTQPARLLKRRIVGGRPRAGARRPPPPGVEAEDRRPPPAGAPAPAALLEQVGLDQLVDARADRV